MKVKLKAEPPVPPGTVILTAKPFAFVLKSKLRSDRCNHCFNRAKVLRCSGCQYLYYCSRECQKQAWNEHKYECNYLRKIAPRTVPDAAHLMARIILKLQRGGDQEKDYYSATGFRKFKDLMSHYSDLKEDAKRMEHFASLSAVLLDLLGESNLPNTAELMGIYGRVCVNSFNILDPEMLAIGTGIYLSASIIDHSCDPNAVAVFEGTTLYIRTIKQFSTLDWKKVRITYIDLLNSAPARRTELQTGYYFLCDCKRCLDSEEHLLMNSVQCPDSACIKPVPVVSALDSDRVCPSCGHNIKSETLKQYQELLDFTQQQLEVMKDIACILSTNLDVCKVCLKKQQGLFHPLNIYHVKMLDLAFESSIEMCQWEQACQFGAEVKQGYRRYYGEFHPLTGIFHLKLGKLLLHQQHVQKAWEELLEAKRILAITHGENHILFKKDFIPLLIQCENELQSEMVS
ncbi:Histone-lysine N-methyltransferase SMYD3 [Gryllus bimaculatus]|nr:Histone-lysine N-methyltransferase SMYD3 [Gryllus bimaculatus]